MYPQHQIFFWKGESTDVTLAPAEIVALWVVCKGELFSQILAGTSRAQAAVSTLQ